MADCEVNNKLHLDKLQNICRLCSSKIDLRSIFDTKFDIPHPFQLVLATVTAIKISRDDKISQNICGKCAATSIQMFRFRHQSRRNDELLRKRYEELVKTIESKSNSSNTNDNYNVAEIIIDPENIKTGKNDELEVLDTQSTEQSSSFNTSKPPKFSSKLLHKIHPTISTLFKEYPNLRVPTICITSNISPRVVLKMNEVENYFIDNNLDFHKHVLSTLDQHRNSAIKYTLTDKFTQSQQSIQLRNLNNVNTNYSAKTQNKTGYNDDDNDDTVLSVRLEQLSKRKLPVESESSEQNVKKKCLEKSLLRPSPAFPSDKIPNLSVASSQPLHACSVCDSHVRYLKRHVNKHLRCQFCKKKFKNFGAKKKHVESQCRIQKIMESMSDLPVIPLVKIELNETVRQKHLKTFSEFGLVPKMEEVRMEIQSDKEKKTTNDIYSKMDQTPFVDIDIKIKGGCLNYTSLNYATDIQIIKNLLEQLRKKENSSSTFLPTNKLIKVSPIDSTIEMKSFKHFLKYNIPIHITKGSTLNVCYSWKSSYKASRENKYWDDLPPIDVNFKSDAHINKSHPINNDNKIKQKAIGSFGEKSKQIDERLLKEVSTFSLTCNENIDIDSKTKNSDTATKLPIINYETVCTTLYDMHHKQKLNTYIENKKQKEDTADLKNQFIEEMMTGSWRRRWQK